MWWRRPFDDISGRIGPWRLRYRGPGRSRLRVLRSRDRDPVRACSCAARSLRCRSRWSFSLPSASASRSSRDRTTSRRGTARSKASAPSSGGARDWILENRLVDAVGRRISTSQEDLAITHAQLARVDPQDYLLSLGWRRAITYQPNDRFWTFQAIEAGLFFALGALAVLGNYHARAQDAGVIDQFDRSGLLRRAGSPALALAALGRAETANAAAAGGSLAGPSPLALRLREPRDHQSLLRSCALRHRRRGVAASASTVEWTGLEAQRRRRDGDGDAPRDRAAGRRHRRLDHRPAGLQRPRRSTALGRGIPVVSYNADGGSRNGGSPTTARPLPIRSRVRREDRRGSCDQGDVYLFIATPGQQNIQPRDRRRPRRHPRLGPPDPRARGRHGRRRLAERAQDRGDLPRDHKNPRGVRRRCRLDAGGARVMHTLQLAPPGVRAGGYDLLPGTLASVARPAGSTSRSTNSPTCRGSCRYPQLFLVPLLERPGLSGRHQHRPELRDPAQCPALPDDSSRFEGSSRERTYPVSSDP